MTSNAVLAPAANDGLNDRTTRPSSSRATRPDVVIPTAPSTTAVLRSSTVSLSPSTNVTAVIGASVTLMPGGAAAWVTVTARAGRSSGWYSMERPVEEVSYGPRTVTRRPNASSVRASVRVSMKLRFVMLGPKIVSSGSQPKAAARSRRTDSICGSRMRHMVCTGASFESSR